MRNAIRKNRKLIVIGVAIILVLLIGISFAYLTTTLHGEKEYAIRAGSLGLKLEEGNELVLEKVIPIEDSEGMSLNGFNFSLVNEGNIDTDFTIYLDDMELSSGETRMPDSAIRYSLIKNSVVGNADNLSNMGSNPNRVVDTGSIEPKQTINYTLRIWIDYDATVEEAGGKTFKGKLRVEVSQYKEEKASTMILNNLTSGSTYDDGEDTFITGEDPNNYIWYSGKLWRAVSVNNEAKTTKLITQWNISATIYNPENQTAFENSYMEEWLNDTTVDGFLGNLRDVDKFLVTDAKWDATMNSGSLGSITRPNGETTVTDAVGLLNLYEYQMSFTGTTYGEGYLNNELQWWLITPDTLSEVWQVNSLGAGETSGSITSWTPTGTSGVRPSIVLREDVRIVSGDGTEENPYRLEGDNDKDLNGVKLNTRYSGEYIRFGEGENNLYRIVSHEVEGLTKITSIEPLKENGVFKTLTFGDEANYSSTTTIGTFLNGEYLTSGNYITNEQVNMIEDSTTWYLGMVGHGENYKLAKYVDTNMTDYTTSVESKVGLLRMGELMAGQFDYYYNNVEYWLITKISVSKLRTIFLAGNGASKSLFALHSIKPALNLKSNVIITSGDGTKNNPFTIELG